MERRRISFGVKMQVNLSENWCRMFVANVDESMLEAFIDLHSFKSNEKSMKPQILYRSLVTDSNLTELRKSLLLQFDTSFQINLAP